MHEPAPVHEPAQPTPSSDVLVDEVHGSEDKVLFFLSICLIFYFYLFMHFISMCPFCNHFLFLLQIDDGSVPPRRL